MTMIFICLFFKRQCSLFINVFYFAVYIVFKSKWPLVLTFYNRVESIFVEKYCRKDFFFLHARLNVF